MLNLYIIIIIINTTNNNNTTNKNNNIVCVCVGVWRSVAEGFCYLRWLFYRAVLSFIIHVQCTCCHIFSQVCLQSLCLNNLSSRLCSHVFLRSLTISTELKTWYKEFTFLHIHVITHCTSARPHRECTIIIRIKTGDHQHSTCILGAWLRNQKVYQMYKHYNFQGNHFMLQTQRLQKFIKIRIDWLYRQ